MELNNGRRLYFKSWKIIHPLNYLSVNYENFEFTLYQEAIDVIGISKYCLASYLNFVFHFCSVFYCIEWKIKNIHPNFEYNRNCILDLLFSEMISSKKQWNIHNSHFINAFFDLNLNRRGILKSAGVQLGELSLMVSRKIRHTFLCKMNYAG